MSERRLRDCVEPLQNAQRDLGGLLERMHTARYVLLGEASHGTHEFYALRAEITKRLIREAGFSIVAVEADWPDAYRVNRFVRGEGTDESADSALRGFERFPRGMWRNHVARATELSAQGELNLGQLMRERHPGRTFALGFSTYGRVERGELPETYPSGL